jgi:hypothetical protein
MSNTDTADYAGYIRIPVHKGCVLVLSPAEYARAVRRGKALRRREVFLQRQSAARAHDGVFTKVVKSSEC